MNKRIFLLFIMVSLCLLLAGACETNRPNVSNEPILTIEPSPSIKPSESGPVFALLDLTTLPFVSEGAFQQPPYLIFDGQEILGYKDYPLIEPSLYQADPESYYMQPMTFIGEFNGVLQQVNDSAWAFGFRPYLTNKNHQDPTLADYTFYVSFGSGYAGQLSQLSNATPVVVNGHAKDTIEIIDANGNKSEPKPLIQGDSFFNGYNTHYYVQYLLAYGHNPPFETLPIKTTAKLEDQFELAAVSVHEATQYPMEELYEREGKSYVTVIFQIKNIAGIDNNFGHYQPVILTDDSYINKFYNSKAGKVDCSNCIDENTTILAGQEALIAFTFIVDNNMNGFTIGFGTGNLYILPFPRFRIENY